MKITFLGTSSGVPSRTRNVSSIALQRDQQSAWWLFDCGEGTQHQILRAPLRLSQLEKVFITHLHGDHLFGLIGLLASRSLQAGGTTPVTLYGPRGLEEYVHCCLRLSQTRPGYPIAIETVRSGLVCEEEDVRVVCAPVEHRIEAFGYAVEEKEQPGHFDVEKARALGIPPGPLYGRLKNGEVITLPDGRPVVGAELVGPTREGRKVVFAGDTTYTQRTVELARNADVLVHEATYLQEDHPLAERAAHSTALMAAQVALKAGVRTLILTHFSTRYEADGGQQLEALLAEARSLFPDSHLARDFWSYEVQRR